MGGGLGYKPSQDYRLRLDCEEAAYLNGLARLVLSPDGLPDELIETLFVIEEMADPAGQERLETVAGELGLDLALGEEASPGDIAVHVWLTRPDVLVAEHKKSRLGRLSAFEYYGAAASASVDEMMPPSPEMIEAMAAELDAWFRRHHRGHRTTRMDVHKLDGEFWFPTQHGDTFRRTVRVDGGRLEVLHFRPAKDDMLVYTPWCDEIRIHAGTKGERELYRRTFGRYLHGNSEHFHRRTAYTLDPLRAEDLGAVRAGDIPGITGVALREVEVIWPGGFREGVVRKASDLFLVGLARGQAAIPATGELVRAVFDFQFKDAVKPRWVEIRTPNTLRLGRHCDARLVHRWLSGRGFRCSENGARPVEEVNHV